MSRPVFVVALGLVALGVVVLLVAASVYGSRP